MVARQAASSSAFRGPFAAAHSLSFAAKSWAIHWLSVSASCFPPNSSTSLFPSANTSADVFDPAASAEDEDSFERLFLFGFAFMGPPVFFLDSTFNKDADDQVHLL